jgi:nondiscriminating glutamyl-tRNA synthetase
MPDMVRTRFAPSPTGFLHLGGLRTALYNLLFAKHFDGRMILRIEDTDQSRFVEGATENLIDTLHAVGIDYDEGPDIEGPNGPYVQSQRIKLYQNYAKELIETNHAYYCFCSQERLAKIRQLQEKEKKQPKYDGYCRDLNSIEVKKRLDQHLPYVVRLKMPQSGQTVFIDQIRGEINFQNELIDDQILIKSDGFSTYHLANVIDDHFMGITHIIRGEEWLQSVPKHIVLYKAFGWDIPKMAHLPLLLNPDRSKLSKSQGDVAVEDFLKTGYLPQSLINFIALLGWNPGDNREIFSLNELITEFSLEKVSKSGAIFDIQKLNWLNGHYIRQMEEKERVDYLSNYLEKSGYDTRDYEKNRKIINSLYKKISYGDEIASQAAIFYKNHITIKDEQAQNILNHSTSKKVLKTFLKKIAQLNELDVQSFQNIMKEVQTETGIKKQELWMPIRIALTGVTHGPDLPVIIELFGIQKIQNFVIQTLSQIN